MDPVDVLFALLLGAGALGFFSLLFVTPAHYASLPRNVTLLLRSLYCIVGLGFAFGAYLIVRDAHSYRAISTALLWTTCVNLMAIALERYWVSRAKRRGSTG